MIALLLLQVAAPVATPTGGQRFSILNDPCAAASDPQGKDIVVCGHPDQVAPRLPLPQFRGPPNHPVPSNPDLSAAVALNGPAGAAECGAYGEACPIGGGGYALPAALYGVADLAHDAFSRRRYKDKGVPIPLEEAKPADLTGKLLP